jgi:hypothetical protein
MYHKTSTINQKGDWSSRWSAKFNWASGTASASDEEVKSKKI